MQPFLPYKVYTTTLLLIKPKQINKQEAGQEFVIISSK